MTPRQKAILSHVVEDADKWYAHALETFGQQLADQFLVDKCKRWEPEFERESKRQDYKTRAQRDEIEKQNDKSIA